MSRERLRLNQTAGMHGVVLIDFIRIGSGIAYIDLAQKNAARAFLEHTKGATGNAEFGRMLAVLETLRHIAPVNSPCHARNRHRTT